MDDLLLLARLDQQRALDVTDVDLLVLATDAVHSAICRSHVPIINSRRFLSLPPTFPSLSVAWASRCRRVSAVKLTVE